MSYLEKTFGLDGKRALVTGASRGIGQAIAIALAQSGADVAVTASKSEEALAETKKMIEAAGRKCVMLVYDISNVDEAIKGVADAAAGLGGLDIVVNNAGSVWPHDALAITPESFQQLMNINLSGAFFTAQKAAEIMSDMTTEGSIINICSITAVQALTMAPLYSTFKAALVMATKGLATQLAGKGVRVNAISPGWTETDMTRPLMGNEEWLKQTQGVTPAGRLGMPEEIASVVVFLASEAARFMHGQNVVVDGGLTIKLA